MAVILFLMVGAVLGHDGAMQVELSAQGGVELLAAPQLLLQSPILSLQALQSAGSLPVTGHIFLLSSSHRPISGVSLA